MRYFSVKNSFISKIYYEKNQFVWRKTYSKRAKNIGRKNDPIKKNFVANFRFLFILNEII